MTTGGRINKSIANHGKHANHKKISNEVKEDLKVFISKIPEDSSHCSREKDTTNMLTLAPRVTKQVLYEEFLKDKHYKASKDWFLKYWAENIPIKVYKNHVDTCNICNSITIAGDEKENHKRDVHKTRQAMKSDKNSFSFDLQKAHTIPVLNTSTAYYKHQLIFYNEEIHDQANSKGYSHLWSENTGRRWHLYELYAFVKNNCKNLNELLFWCDNCGGQNENQYIAQALIYTVNTMNIKLI